MARLGGARRRLRALRLAVRRSRGRPGRRSASRPNRSDQRPRRWRSKRWHASAAQRSASKGYCKTLLTFRCPLADGRVCSEGLSVVQADSSNVKPPIPLSPDAASAPLSKPIAFALSRRHSRPPGLRLCTPAPSIIRDVSGGMAAAARLPLRFILEGRTSGGPWSGPKQKTDLCLSVEKVIGRHTATGPQKSNTGLEPGTGRGRA